MTEVKSTITQYRDILIERINNGWENAHAAGIIELIQVYYDLTERNAEIRQKSTSQISKESVAIIINNDTTIELQILIDNLIIGNLIASYSSYRKLIENLVFLKLINYSDEITVKNYIFIEQKRKLAEYGKKQNPNSYNEEQRVFLIQYDEFLKSFSTKYGNNIIRKKYSWTINEVLKLSKHKNVKHINFYMITDVLDEYYKDPDSKNLYKCYKFASVFSHAVSYEKIPSYLGNVPEYVFDDSIKELCLRVKELLESVFFELNKF